MAGAIINTMAEGMPKLLQTLSLMKGAADADLAWITDIETQVIQRMNPALSQGPQLPGGPPNVAGPSAPGGMAPMPPAMGGGGMGGIPTAPSPNMGPTDLGEISMLLNKRS